MRPAPGREERLFPPLADQSGDGEREILEQTKKETGLRLLPLAADEVAVQFLQKSDAFVTPHKQQWAREPAASGVALPQREAAAPGLEQGMAPAA